MNFRIIRDGEDTTATNKKLPANDFGNGDGGGSDDDTVDVSESLEKSYELQRRLKVSLHRLNLQIRLSWTVLSFVSLALIANIVFMIYGFGFATNQSKDMMTTLEIMPGIMILLVYLTYAFSHTLIEQLSLRYETNMTEQNLTTAIENVEKELAAKDNESD
jgi:hypothetical protein